MVTNEGEDMRKISSMNLFHTSGWRWSGANHDNNDFSNQPMKMLA